MNALLIENDALARLLLEKQIRAFGFAVTTCMNGATALEAVKQTFYAVIILDLGLPDMYGLELCRRIRALPGRERSILVALTERHDPEYLQAVIALGVNDYLAKPVNPDLLKSRLTIIARHAQTLSRQDQITERLRQLKRTVETFRA